jgi:4-diphosphocytidyl-2C-methyl-D-erythritol kinase
VVLVHPSGATKASTGAVYGAFDERGGEDGFAGRRAALQEALAGIRRPRDLAALPPNDLASSPIAAELRDLGAFRADVTGAGPTVYGLFLHGSAARSAEREMRSRGRTWVTAPAWYR